MLDGGIDPARNVTSCSHLLDDEPPDPPMFVKGCLGLGAETAGASIMSHSTNEAGSHQAKRRLLSEHWVRAADRHVGRRSTPQGDRYGSSQIRRSETSSCVEDA
jgi:hypothetical protein